MLRHGVDRQTGYNAATNRITLAISNLGSQGTTVDVVDKYSGKTMSEVLGAGASVSQRWPLARFDGWYDFLITATHDPDFAYQLAGHLETGKDSISDPAMGGRV